MTAVNRGLRSAPLSLCVAGVLLSGCSGGLSLSQLARGKTFMQGLASGGVVEEGDVAVLASNAEADDDDKVTPIETVPEKTMIVGPDGKLIEVDATQTSFIEGGFFQADKTAEGARPAAGDSTAYMGKGPSVQGQRLNLKPGQTATEKALELQEELQASSEREEALEGRVAELEVEIEKKNERIVQAIREMNATRNELIAVRGQLEAWATNMNELRSRIQSAEADNLATMQTIISLLQQFLQVESDMKLQDAAPLNLEDLLPGQGQP